MGHIGFVTEKRKYICTLSNTKDKKKIKGGDKIVIKGRVCTIQYIHNGQQQRRT